MKCRRSFTLTAASTLAVVMYLFSAGTAFGATPGAGKLGLDDPLCASQLSSCADAVGQLNGYYVGHDEPSLLFKSKIPGSGERHDVRDDAAEGPEDASRTRPATRRAARGTSSFVRRSGSE